MGWEPVVAWPKLFYSVIICKKNDPFKFQVTSIVMPANVVLLHLNESENVQEGFAFVEQGI